MSFFLPDQHNSTQPSWPATFAEVEAAQLKVWLGMTPAQRLAMAEELFTLARMAEESRARNNKSK